MPLSTPRSGAFGARAQGLRLERMSGSPRFRGGVFHNTAPVNPGLQPGSAWGTFLDYLSGGQRRTPPAPLPSTDPRPTWGRPVQSGLRVTWLGHSTLLLEVDGVRLLTDPVWGERASPWELVGPRRFQPVPVGISELPPIDAVLVSHDHYDHLDHPSVLQLARTTVPFITSLGVGAHLESWGVPSERITELDWWESADVRGVRVTAAPSQHFSGRGPSDRNRTLWSAFAIQGERHRVFFSGDTGLTPEYQEIRARLGPFDLVMLEVGAWHPSWGTIHLGPVGALDALDLLGGGALLPVHWGTFNLALHAWDEPAEVLLREAPARGARLVLPRLGEPVEPDNLGQPEPWWRRVAG